MTLDATTVLAVTGLVIVVSGSLFVIETLLRRDEGAGRIWALAFIAAMLTVLAYLIWLQTPGAWWATAIGNGGLVAANGCMWLGCAAYNGRALRWPAVAVGAASLAAIVAVWAAGPDGGDWAGAPWMFVPVLVFAGLAAIECLRGALGSTRTAAVLAVVLAVEALYYISRTTAFLTSGPDSALFQTAFGTVPTSLLSVVLIIVAVVVASVLRAARAPMRGYSEPAPTAPGDGILGASGFARELSGLLARAERRAETVAVISVRVADLDEVSTAFGSEMAREVAEALRTAVRRHAASDALVGDDADGGVLVAALVDGPRDAQRVAARLHRGLFDDLADAGAGVIPVVGVGLATSDAEGYALQDLLGPARSGASRAATSVEGSFSAEGFA